MSRAPRSKSAKKGGGAKNPWSQADKFTKQAKAEGYLARSVYKLDEINKRFRIFQQGQRVADLGCSPGSWLVWAQEKVGKHGHVMGVDILEPGPVDVPFVVRDIFEVTPGDLMQALDGPADVVLSDMAPRTTGNTLGEHVRQIELATRALEIAKGILVPGGHFVVKVFDGEEAHAYVQSIRPHFEKVKRVRPEAVRQQSREFFVVAQGFIPPDPMAVLAALAGGSSPAPEESDP
jgi:23S rRNA (uridine2552-2'-O)-methyltransferase